MKKIISLIMMLILALTLTSCWAGEISVETSFNANGSGVRRIVLDVMDETLTEEVIANPEDPEGTKDKGPVINNPHIEGGLLEIQTWLKANAPEFITVLEPEVDGYHRYFILEYEFDSFDDFMDKYKQLINLSTTIEWSDFDEDDHPTFSSKGLFKKEVEFRESKAMLEATLDWAITGIWEDIYDDQGLGAFGLEKANISVLAGYKVTINDETYELTSGYDPTVEDGEHMGKYVYISDSKFEAEGAFSNTTAVILVSVAAVAVVGGAAVGVVFFLRKRK